MRLGCSYCVFLLSLFWWSSHVDANFTNNPNPSRVIKKVSKKSLPFKVITTSSIGSFDKKIVGGSNESEEEGTATIPNEIFNLVKSIVGAGVLSLPAGKCTQQRILHHYVV